MTMFDFTHQSDYVWALLPEIVLSLWAMLVLLVDVFQKGNRSEPSSPTIPWLSLAGLGAAAAANTWLIGAQAVSEGLIAVDGFRVFINFVILIAAALSILISIGFLDRNRINRGEFHALTLFSTVGMMVMASSRDLILMFLGLELMSICVYVLVGFNREDPRSGEGSLKYFLLGAFSSAFFLYGVALIFGATGSTNLSVVGPLLETGLAASPLFLVGAGLILVGLCFKVAAVPFHMWTPDAYDGAPTPVTAFMATGVKAAAFAAFLRIFGVAFGGAYEIWGPVLWWLAVITMFVANLIGLTQGSVKRMLAYSSVAHAGYLLVALLSRNTLGASAFLFYLLVYTLMTAGAFGMVIVSSRTDKERISLDDYAGLGWEQPVVGAVFSIFLLSLAGFPLTAGFVGKLYILRAALSAGPEGLTLAIALVIASLISYFYYLRVVVVMYMRPAPAEVSSQAALVGAGAARTTVILAAIAVVVLFLYPRPVMRWAEQSVAGVISAPARPMAGR
jgi:NADH-quinone oxidoreductase subunit N